MLEHNINFTFDTIFVKSRFCEVQLSRCAVQLSHKCIIFELRGFIFEFAHLQIQKSKFGYNF